MATTAIEAGLQTIPLDRITANPFNPRKHFEKAPLQELAESIKVHGVRQPVIVRPKDKGFQLVVGERRWRASKLAGKADIPAIVDVNMDDRTALEVMVIENLQREDVHPLDEARGYEALMESASGRSGDPGTAESIAAKVGKSVGYVYARLKLLSLTPAAREAFQQGHISAGHSVLIARLQPFDQLKALAACFKPYVTKDEEAAIKKGDPKLMNWEQLGDALGLDFGGADDPEDRWGGPGGLRLASEKYLREWIQDNVNLRLKDVPWDLTDSNLFPAAGACSDCPKRSASNPALFAELTVKGEDTCFDAECYGKKREAFVKLELRISKQETEEAQRKERVDPGKHPASPIRQISEQSAYTAPKQDQRVLKAGQWLEAKTAKECDTVEEALIVNGENAGVRKLVCCNGKCKVHKHHFQEPMSSSSARSEDPAAKAKRELESEINDLIVERVLGAAVKRIKKPDTKVLNAIIDGLMSNWYGDLDAIARLMGQKSGEGIDKLQKRANLVQLTQLAYLVAISNDLTHWSPEFKNVAKFGAVDLVKLRKQLEKELTPPVQTSVKAKAAAKGK